MALRAGLVVTGKTLRLRVLRERVGKIAAVRDRDREIIEVLVERGRVRNGYGVDV
jgi:hypothetical protein